MLLLRGTKVLEPNQNLIGYTVLHSAYSTYVNVWMNVCMNELNELSIAY